MKGLSGLFVLLLLLGVIGGCASDHENGDYDGTEAVEEAEAEDEGMMDEGEEMEGEGEEMEGEEMEGEGEEMEGEEMEGEGGEEEEEGN